MKTIVVAGGAGFIGHHLCERLVSEGHFVIVVDNLITGSKKNIVSQCKFVNGSVCNEKIIEAFRISPIKIDEIYHLASPASPVHYIAYPWSTIRANIHGTHNLMNLAFQEGAKFLFASTSEVYGDPEVSVQSEDYFGNVNTQSNRAVYDESKRMGEVIVATSNRENKTQYKIARIFNTFGPNMALNDGRVIPEFICNALRDKDLIIYGSGIQTRSFCYVSDMVDGLIRLMERNETGPINLGNPENYYCIFSLAEKIIKMTGSKSQIRQIDEFPTQNDPVVRKPDIHLAMKTLLWAPKISLGKGLEKTIEYFRST